jgi:tetratricopeptide (TPR) repeat protein
LRHVIVLLVTLSVHLRSDIRHLTEGRIILVNLHRSATFCTRRILLPALALLCLFGASTVLAATAYDAFEDGNRLFRDNLYWAALLRYQQASDAGMDTPLLHYNSGIAHYRAKQHIRARQSFTKALAAPGLRLVSQYNLGLNAYAAGDTEEALRWFRLSRDQDENPQISRLSRIAISRLQQTRQTTDPYLVKAKQEREKRHIADFFFNAATGFGTDSNPFRTPSQPYIDFSNPNLPLVTPVVQSGAYIPVSLTAKYSINNFEHESFFGAYRMAGRFYQDKELENADEYSHEFALGGEYRRKQGSRTREVYSAFTVAQHAETYFDPDDGTIRTSDGESIEDRMNYRRYGPELSFRQSHDHLSVGAFIKGQLWNYEETNGLVPEYDHEYVILGLNTQYKFAPTSLLRVRLEKYSRRFGDRPSYDLDGQPRQGNPNVSYDYLELGLLARQRLFERFWFDIYFDRTNRDDNYVGYNDYVRDTIGLSMRWTHSARFRVRLYGEYRLYDFPNAYAFHNPVAGPKTLETAEAKLTTTYEMTRHLDLIFEARYRDTASNDTRIAYDRNLYSLWVRWNQ